MISNVPYQDPFNHVSLFQPNSSPYWINVQLYHMKAV